MNETTWERLVWKEHRMLRGLWVAAVVLCGLVLFAMAWQMKSTGDPTLFFQVAMGITACYALGCGAEAFAGEREARTDLFQSALPASGRQLLIAKSSHAALSALALLVVLWCLAWLAVGAWLRDFSGTITLGLEPAVLGVVTTVQLLAWATLFSLRSTSPLWVVVWAFAFNALTTYPVAWLFGEIPEDYRTGWYFPSLLGDLPSALPRLVIAAAVGYGCWRWALHWTREEGQPSRWRLRRWESLDRFAAGLLNRFEGWPRWQRLMWQQWQSAQWYLVAIGLLYAVFIAAAMIAAPTFELPTWTAPFLLICSLFGTGVFHDDHRRRHVRFLSEHGVTPGILWWARQSFWFTLFAGCGLIVFVFAMLATKGLEWSYAYEQKGYVPFYFFAALSFYAAGQWASLWVRSAILRILVSIGLCLTLTCWLLLMLIHRIPMWWSTGVIPLALLGASRLGMHDWMRDQIGKRTRRIQLLALAVPTVAVLAGVIVYRWTEIPRATPEFTLAPRTEAERAAASAKGAEYLLASASLDLRLEQEPPLASELDDPNARKDEFDPAEYDELAWGPVMLAKYEKNEPVIRRVLEVIPGPYAISAEALATEAWQKQLPPKPANYSDTSNYWTDVGVTQMTSLTSALMFSAEKHQQAGDLQEALRRYLCAFQLIVNQQAEEGPTSFFQTRYHYPALMRRLQRWAAEPGQTPELIRQALREVATPVEWIGNEEREIQRRYRLGRASLNGDEEAFAELCRWRYHSLDEATAKRLYWVYRFLPWERWRALRLLDANTVAQMRELTNVRDALQQNEVYIDGIAKENGAEWRRSPTYSIVDHEARRHSSVFSSTSYWLESINLNRRVTLIILALEGWALEHGALPDTLEQLVPDWLDSIPLDPLTGKSLQYFPQGVNMELRWRMPTVGYYQFVIPPGRPFLLSSIYGGFALKDLQGGPIAPTALLFAIPVRKTEPSP